MSLGESGGAGQLCDPKGQEKKVVKVIHFLPGYIAVSRPFLLLSGFLFIAHHLLSVYRSGVQMDGGWGGPGMCCQKLKER